MRVVDHGKLLDLVRSLIRVVCRLLSFWALREVDTAHNWA